MAKAKFVIAHFRCKECNTPSRTTKHGKKPLKEMKIFCVKCKKHTLQKPKDIKKPAKK
ncbi:50S ribosomal protein L33 [Candidatus Peregrinibacteria bacterium]|nr:50S ribosomal protein L33 [Candidatus Peregrinibacteria bacterium]